VLAGVAGGRHENQASFFCSRAGLDMTRSKANRRSFATVQVRVSISYEKSAAMSQPAAGVLP
jgi:hypothetical protein